MRKCNYLLFHSEGRNGCNFIIRIEGKTYGNTDTNYVILYDKKGKISTTTMAVKELNMLNTRMKINNKNPNVFLCMCVCVCVCVCVLYAHQLPT